MNHFNAEELVDLYYSHTSPDHLQTCPECRAKFESLRETLEAARAYSVPDRGPGYGREVWARLTPHLVPVKTHRFRWWMFTPVFAAMLTLAFMAGRFSKPVPAIPEISEKSRERVLLLSLSDHFERAQIVLSELQNAEPGAPAFAEQRDRARELVGANRLLRLTAERIGDTADTAVLEDLEHVLLEVANAPDTPSLNEAAFIRERIQEKGLLFKVRISSADSRERGMKL